MLSILAEGAFEYGNKLNDEQIAQFERDLELLQAWAQRANLVGDHDLDVLQRRHLLESIALGAALREREILRPDASVLEVGAGAGFSGVSMKIVWPSVR